MFNPVYPCLILSLTPVAEAEYSSVPYGKKQNRGISEDLGDVTHAKVEVGAAGGGLEVRVQLWVE